MNDTIRELLYLGAQVTFADLSKDRPTYQTVRVHVWLEGKCTVDRIVKVDKIDSLLRGAITLIQAKQALDGVAPPRSAVNMEEQIVVLEKD